jgi:HNH endonuclease
MPRLSKYATPEERITAGRRRVLDMIIEHPDGCWDFAGGKVAGGYGALNVRLGGRDDPKIALYAHRVAYEHYVGPIPDDMEIDHLCKNKSCSRPDHLEAVTHQENIYRGWYKDDATVPCKNGHVGDFWRSPTQGRKCRQCQRDRRAAATHA